MPPARLVPQKFGSGDPGSFATRLRCQQFDLPKHRISTFRQHGVKPG
jgi:hypothetical protein